METEPNAIEMQAMQGISQNGYLQTPMNQMGSAILTLTNPEAELYKLELFLRSLREGPDGNLQPIDKPLMNEKGIGALLSAANALINRVSILSNLDKDEVGALVDFAADTLCRDLMLNRVHYDIKSITTRDLIFFNVLSTVYTTLKRGYMAGERGLLKGSVSEIKFSTQGNQPQKTGLFNSLAQWRK